MRRHGRDSTSKGIMRTLILGATCLILGLFILPALALPQPPDTFDEDDERMIQEAFIDAIKACEATLAQAMENDEEFSCRDAQASLPTRWDEHVVIIDTAPNSCLILVTPEGSFTAAALPWNNP